MKQAFISIFITFIAIASAQNSFGADNRMRQIANIDELCAKVSKIVKNDNKSIVVTMREPAPDGNDEYEFRETITFHYGYTDNRQAYLRQATVNRNNHGSLYEEEYIFRLDATHSIARIKTSHIEYGDPPQAVTTYYYDAGKLIGQKTLNGTAIQSSKALKRADIMLNIFKTLISQMD